MSSGNFLPEIVNAADRSNKGESELESPVNYLSPNNT